MSAERPKRKRPTLKLNTTSLTALEYVKDKKELLSTTIPYSPLTDEVFMPETKLMWQQMMADTYEDARDLWANNDDDEHEARERNKGNSSVKSIEQPQSPSSNRAQERVEEFLVWGRYLRRADRLEEPIIEESSTESLDATASSSSLASEFDGSSSSPRYCLPILTHRTNSFLEKLFQNRTKCPLSPVSARTNFGTRDAMPRSPRQRLVAPPEPMAPASTPVHLGCSTRPSTPRSAPPSTSHHITPRPVPPRIQIPDSPVIRWRGKSISTALFPDSQPVKALTRQLSEPSPYPRPHNPINVEISPTLSRHGPNLSVDHDELSLLPWPVSPTELGDALLAQPSELRRPPENNANLDTQPPSVPWRTILALLLVFYAFTFFIFIIFVLFAIWILLLGISCTSSSFDSPIELKGHSADYGQKIP